MLIFVSSTFADLRPERNATIDVLRGLSQSPNAMEFFVAEPAVPLKTVLKHLRESRLVVLVIGSFAGSILSRSKDLTYTYAEFRHARRWGLPVLAFVKTEGGMWQNQETDPDRRGILDQFKNEVSNAVLPAYFETVNDLKVAVLQAFQKWQAEGCPGSRRTFASWAEFFSVRRRPRLFDYEQVLCGREKELEALDGFLADKALKVGVLAGRGGIGKSKLLHDWTQSLRKRRVLFMRDGAVWHGESDKEIPEGRVLIVVDDAHRSPDLDKVISFTKQLNERQNVKLLIGTRPSGSARIDQALTRRFEPNQIRRFPELKKLVRRDVRKLAAQLLGGKNRGLVAPLVAVSADTPLVTVIGARLLLRETVTPAVLGNAEAFRRVVFDRFLEEYQTASFPELSFNPRSLIDLVAALGPVNDQQLDFIQKAEKFLGLRSDEIAIAISTLERHGLMLHQAGEVRIVPDVLSDYLLEQRCWDISGNDTRYGKSVFEAFRESHLANIAQNLAQLDWRVGQQKTGDRILDSIWEKIVEDVKAASAGERASVLESLQGAAPFIPKRILELVHFVIENPAQEEGRSRLFTLDQEHVLRSIPSLLEAVAYDPVHMADAVDILWDLAQSDVRRSNSFPDHAIGVLKRMASYDRYKAVTYNLQVADIIAQLLKKSNAFEGEFTPLDMIDQLLEREGDFSDLEGITFSIGTFELNYRNIRPIRETALVMLENVLSSANRRAAVGAVRSVSKLVAGSVPKLRQQTRRELLWQNKERLRALQILEKQIENPRLDVAVAQQIQSRLRAITNWNAKSTTVAKVQRLLKLIPQSDDLVILDALCTGAWDLDSSADLKRTTFDRSDARFKQKLDLTIAVLQRMPDEKQLDKLTELYAVATECRIEIKSGFELVHELCGRRSFLAELTRFLLDGSPSPQFATLIRVVLRRIRQFDANEYRKVGTRAAQHPNLQIVRSTAAGLFGMETESNAVSDDLVLLRLLAEQHDEWTLLNVLSALRFVGRRPDLRAEATEIALLVKIGDEARLIDEFAEIFGPYGMGFDSLTNSQIEGIFQKLLPAKELDGHNVEMLVSHLFTRCPQRTLRFLIDRIDHAAALQSQDVWTYQAIPHHLNLHSLQTSDQYRSCLVDIREHVKTSIVTRREYVRLFWSVGTLDGTVIEVISEWVESSDHANFEAILEILMDAPKGIPFLYPDFACRLLDNAQKLGNDMSSQALGRMLWNVTPRSYSGSMTGPPPVWVNLEQQAAEFAVKYVSVSTLRTLYEQIRQLAIQNIEAALKESAHFRERHE